MLVFCTSVLAPPCGAFAAGYGHSAIVQRDGYPVFTVDGKPFFVYGASFFYERLPRDLWRDSMVRLRSLGINTLDLYVPWNWHELSDGDFDFDGHTSPRRDLHEVMRLARSFGFKIILRPGPVIRNEWRNGGYPAWLLERPEYGMPQHDLLEGRYPPTATLQNANSDDAAAAWMANATHMHYARRWLERVLHEFEPVADLVIAVQLDDDQGAYIDNQTWPAPHLAAYLRWLASVVHGVTGPAEPVFINTYDMKVTGSSPVWAMGNWYQSDTYSIGEHDRTQLELATGLLQTQRDKPVMVSEFQAGWLEQPDDIRPRAADPSNTELAIGTIIGLGGRGIVNFPAQDTLYPSGMEAPFANAFYAWDAALPLDPTSTPENPRAVPTRRMGDIIARYGPQLASSHVVADAGIVYLTSAYDATRITNTDIAEIAAQTAATQRSCRAFSLTCTLVDLRYTSPAALERLPMLIVPQLPTPTAATAHLMNAALDRLAAYARHGGIVIPLSRPLDRALPNTLLTSATSLNGGLVALALHAAHHRRTVSFVPGASFATSTDGSGLGFLTIENYQPVNVRYGTIVLRPSSAQRIVLRDVVVPARRVLIAPVRVKAGHSGKRVLIAEATVEQRVAQSPAAALPIRRDQTLPDYTLQPVGAGKAMASLQDVYREGSDAVVLQNSVVRLVVAPNAGARAFVFEDLATGTSIFTTVGALRDDVKIEPPLSTVDKIAKYTHQFPAGMFNRPYTATIVPDGANATARFSYDAPDVVPHGAHFERTLSLAPEAHAFTVDEIAQFPGDEGATQRAVSVTSLAVGAATTMTTAIVLSPRPSPLVAETTINDPANVVGFYDTASH
ncbi:MAG TPA: beta-galactosidase, partial [Candidatus Acidoferrales bacterium]|nr:beta-galactosidase [Candidatus Acidoferrales bacterium]